MVRRSSGGVNLPAVLRGQRRCGFRPCSGLGCWRIDAETSGATRRPRIDCGWIELTIIGVFLADRLNSCPRNFCICGRACRAKQAGKVNVKDQKL